MIPYEFVFLNARFLNSVLEKNETNTTISETQANKRQKLEGGLLRKVLLCFILRFLQFYGVYFICLSFDLLLSLWI